MNYDRLLTRVYDKQENRMLYPGDGYLCIDNESINFGWNVGKNDFRKLLFGDRFVPMQCLGRKDQNDKLVYELDFARYTNKRYRLPLLGIIKIENRTDAFRLHSLDSRRGFFNFSLNDCEIIGNWWENPQILEEKTR